MRPNMRKQRKPLTNSRLSPLAPVDDLNNDDLQVPFLNMPRILFVSGFNPQTRARDLAYEFERYVPPSSVVLRVPTSLPLMHRYGPLIRCDVPAPRNPHSNSNP